MSQDTTLSDPHGYTISAVERETGVSKDTLRMWERRYGFPRPRRNAQGERIYTSDQVARLRLIRRLLDQGMRPGRIFSLQPEALSALAGEAPGSPERPPLHERALSLLKSHRTVELRRTLHQALVSDGLARFVSDTAAPLACAVGEAWLRGEIQVHEEHVFTEQLETVLRQAIGQLVGAGAPPRMLLTTLSGEQHSLPLLMAEAAFTLEGAECVQLGAETPAADIVAAAEAYRVDAVALSFSTRYPLTAMRDELRLLRTLLPRHVELWCGGSGVARLRRPEEGVRAFIRLEGVSEAISALRAARTHP
jgi:MerR family transcriptional regulator, light-induced transcriptional regulator